MLFIPAIDLIDGQCVRLERGDYGQRTRYDRDPIETAVLFQQEGARYLHIVDLDAAKNSARHNRHPIGRIIAAVDMPVQVGGGVRDREGVEELFDLGVDRIILGTMIVKDQALAGELVSRHGSRLAAGIDARDGMVRVSGWTEGSDLSAMELAERAKDMGFSLIIYTDIERDGMLEGPNVTGIHEMAKHTGIPLVAAGGISRMADLASIRILEQAGVVGVISGKAIYEGLISVREACTLLQS
jgi:phosphoribosylformimino-5-aminoimidazole carboxamide ribotide isomerase